MFYCDKMASKSRFLTIFWSNLISSSMFPMHQTCKLLANLVKFPQVVHNNNNNNNNNTNNKISCSQTFGTTACKDIPIQRTQCFQQWQSNQKNDRFNLVLWQYSTWCQELSFHSYQYTASCSVQRSGRSFGRDRSSCCRRRIVLLVHLYARWSLCTCVHITGQQLTGLSSWWLLAAHVFLRFLHHFQTHSYLIIIRSIRMCHRVRYRGPGDVSV